MRLLVVEDDLRLADLLAKGLRENAYAVDLAADGDQALYFAAINEYDGIVLDVGLPKKDGFTVVKEIRKKGIKTPVLMLTARDAIPDRVTGLDLGADDYLTKPFDFSEFLARVRALIRRTPVVLSPEIVVADLVINVAGQTARRGPVDIELTAKEFALLEFLGRHANEVVSRTAINSHVWDDNHDPASNTIEVYINRLRKKIDLPGLPSLIHTRRGAGYRIGLMSNLS